MLGSGQHERRSCFGATEDDGAPAAVTRMSTLPLGRVGFGISTSFRPLYPTNDSARIAPVIIPPKLRSFLFRHLVRVGPSEFPSPRSY